MNLTDRSEQAKDKRGEPMPQELSPHLDDSKGRRNFLGANPHAFKDRVAPPKALLGVHGLEDLVKPLLSRIDQKTIGLGQDSRPEGLRISSKSWTHAVADSAEDAVDVGVDLLAFFLAHSVF